MNTDTPLVIPDELEFVIDRGVITSAIGPKEAMDEIRQIVGHPPQDADEADEIDDAPE